MRFPRGTALLIVLLLLYTVVLFGRKICCETDLSAEVFVKSNKIQVLLANGFPAQGIYQFNDGMDLYSAIKLTVGERVDLSSLQRLSNVPLKGGEVLSLAVKDNEIIDVNVKWMAAEQRLACGVALHPDRMNVADWQALPGIGPRLAEKIEKDRQENGDFGSLTGLRRVPGLGEKTIDGLKVFFDPG